MPRPGRRRSAANAGSAMLTTELTRLNTDLITAAVNIRLAHAHFASSFARYYDLTQSSASCAYDPCRRKQEAQLTRRDRASTLCQLKSCQRVRNVRKISLEKACNGCKLNIVLISLWGLMHKIYPTSRYQNVSLLSFWDQYYNIAPYFCATKCD